MSNPINTIAYSGTIPAFYDSLLGPLYFQPYAEYLGREIASVSPSNILELACGTGRLTHEILKHFPSVDMTVTDINPSMLAHAKQSLSELKNIQWGIADAIELPYVNNSFDCVAVQFGVMFYTDKIKGYKEANRVLKEGGKFIFSTWNDLNSNTVAAITHSVIEEFFPVDTPPFYRFPFSYHDPKIIENDLRAAGFDKIEIELVKLKGYSASAFDAAKGLLEGTPAHTAIMERDANALHPMEKRLEEKLIAEYGTNSFEPALEAYVVKAIK